MVSCCCTTTGIYVGWYAIECANTCVYTYPDIVVTIDIDVGNDGCVTIDIDRCNAYCVTITDPIHATDVDCGTLTDGDGATDDET